MAASVQKTLQNKALPDNVTNLQHLCQFDSYVSRLVIRQPKICQLGSFCANHQFDDGI